MVDKSKLLQLGGFDEIYAPLYYEDTDLSVKAWRAGWRCYYEHEAICRHPASSTINKFNKKRNVWIITQRNKLIFHSIHLNKNSKLVWNFRQMVTLVVQAFAFRWKYHSSFLLFLRKKEEINASREKSENTFSINIETEIVLDSIRKELDSLPLIKLYKF